MLKTALRAIKQFFDSLVSIAIYCGRMRSQLQSAPSGNGNIVVDGVSYLPDFFVYELDFAAAAPAGTPNLSFTVQANSHFLWQYAAYAADIAAAAYLDSTRPVPNVSAMITDSGSGRQLMSANVPIPAVFGTGQLPFQLPAPRLFKALSNVQVTLLNFDAAVTYNLKLSFIGLKLFPDPNATAMLQSMQQGTQGH